MIYDIIDDSLKHCQSRLIHTTMESVGVPEEVSTTKPELIFVTNITNYIRGEKLSCGEIWSFYKEFEQFMEFYQSLCRFCFQIDAEKNLPGEKMTNMRSGLGVFVPKPFFSSSADSLFSAPPQRRPHICHFFSTQIFSTQIFLHKDFSPHRFGIKLA